MNSNAETVRLGDCISFVIDNRGKTPPLSNIGYELIETTSIVGTNKYPDFQKVTKFVDAEIYRSWFRKGHPQKGDILISTVGLNIGNVCILNKKRGCIAQNLVGLRSDPKKLDPEFLYYFLTQDTVQNSLKNLDIGSAQPNLKVPHLLNLKCKFPKINEQIKISSILCSFDDRIDLLRETNKTLEAIAQAIFKSWFVDFDPVRAKQEGREPEGMDADTAALFPDSFEESELGLIPKGWIISPLSEVCTKITDGSHFSPKSVVTGFPMASVKDMREWGFDKRCCRKITEEDYLNLIKNNCRPLKNDVLIAKDGSYLKHIFVVEKDLDLVILSSIAILRPNSKVDSNLLAFTLRSENTMSRMGNYVSGAVLQRIVLKDFRKFLILVPPESIQKEWGNVIDPIMRRIWHNTHQSETLTSLRDTLLPRLISGQLRLPDVESTVKEAIL